MQPRFAPDQEITPEAIEAIKAKARRLRAKTLRRGLAGLWRWSLRQRQGTASLRGCDVQG